MEIILTNHIVAYVGFMGGFGTGLINVSSIVAVNKYFDAKREIATGMKMFE